MAENEYLDSSKARRWLSVAQAIRDECSDEEIADRIQECFYKTLRAIAKDLPLSDMFAAAAHDPAELARMCDGIKGGHDVKDFLLQAAQTRFGTETMLETFLNDSLNNCPACIFRRVALHAAGIEEPNVTYQHDLLDPNAPKLARRKMNYLLAFLNQIDGLSSTTGRCLPLSVSKHLSRTELIRAGEPQQPFIDLYAKYHREWMSFIRTAKAKGCQWCDLIELPTKAA